MDAAMTWVRQAVGIEPSRSMGLRTVPPAVSVLRVAQWMLVTACLLGVGASWYWWEHSEWAAQRATVYELAAAKTEDQNRRAAALMAREGLTISPEQAAALKQEIAFANQLASQRDFSWTQLLSDLEAVVPDSVSIGSVRVEHAELTVLVIGSARTLTAVNRFVENAQNHPAFRKAVLQSHHVHPQREEAGPAASEETRLDSAERPVDFTLSVVYRPAF